MIVALSASAKIELHSLFGDNMILQRDASNSIWGWVAPGASVEVKASWGATANTKADEDGKWVVLLNTPGPGTGHGLTISSGKEVVQIKNLAVGEVDLPVLEPLADEDPVLVAPPGQDPEVVDELVD